jgi:cytochrome c2
MNRAHFCAAALCALLAACGGPLQGDAARGEQIHRACTGCHDTELYVPPAAKVKTLRELEEQVEVWNDRMNPKLDEQEIADVVAYLNRDFYKLK